MALDTCALCSAAVYDLDVDANVRLHDHLEAHPRHRADFEEHSRAWGNASWTANASGAA